MGNNIKMLMNIIFHLLFFFYNCSALKTRLKSSMKLIQSDDNTSINAFCFVNYNGIVYDLGKLYDDSSNYFIKNNQSYFYFNFCKFAHMKCKKDSSYIIHKSIDSPDDCHLMSSPNNKTTPQWKIKKENGNNNDSITSIEIAFPQGESCLNGNTSSYYNTKYIIQCDHSVPNVMFDNPTEISIDKCDNVIKMRSQYACPDIVRYSLSNTMRNNKIIIGLIILFIGIYFCFFAYKFLKPTRILTGVVIMNLITFIIASSWINANFSTLSFYIMLVLSSVVGIGLGYALMKFPYVVGPFLGALMGYVLTEIIFNLFAGLMKWNPRAVYFILLSSIGLLGVILGIIFQQHVFIVGSGFGGAYGILKGFGLLQDNFPLESQIYDFINKKEYDQLHQLLDYKFYLYIVFVIAFSICGIVFQYKRYYHLSKGNEREFNKAA